VKQLQRGIDGLKATGAQLRLPLYYALLAEAHAAAGQPREALASVSTGFAFLSRNGEAWPEAELHRVHGEALERSGQRREAAESYRKGIEAAHRVGAAVFEQRCLEGLRRVEGLRTTADSA
jgi:tetratricopeptide (TPR) repeat protein